MAGIYIHIPFCRDACRYCDFHFSISLKYVKPMLSAIKRELFLRRSEFDEQKPNTLYIGGGTPSILLPEQIKSLLQCVRKNYNLDYLSEITMEANPDDLKLQYLIDLKKLGINRLSIGIQSFYNDDLKILNRIHDEKQALSCLENARNAGFDNINIDLIYGLPGSALDRWRNNLEVATRFLPEHISAYHLTYEAGTVMNHLRLKKRIRIINEEESLNQYNLLNDHLDKFGYRHYEVSNFAREGKISRHNMSYWTGEAYLGIGPSAHSYDGHSRRWNLAKNSSYIKALSKGLTYFEKEVPDEKSKYHEYLLTGLRTSRGIDPEFILKKWGADYYRYFREKTRCYLKSGKLVEKDNILRLSREGMFISDYIISDFFMQH